jgi:hypothetical protein
MAHIRLRRKCSWNDVGHTQRSYELATADFLLEFFARCFRLIPPTPVSNCHLNSMI